MEADSTEGLETDGELRDSVSTKLASARSPRGMMFPRPPKRPPRPSGEAMGAAVVETAKTDRVKATVVNNFMFRVKFDVVGLEWYGELLVG
jgi:hypothetical protein